MNWSGSPTSSPLRVKLISRAIAPGINTESANSSRAGARKPQAVAVPGVGRELEASGMGPL